MKIHPVVLCGGNGTRLWPMSRGQYPKQYLKLTGEKTLLQQTVLRLAHITGTAEPIVVTNGEQRFLVAEQLRQADVKPSSIVLEPVSRNTAPAIAVAALLALRESPDALLLVLPSDHVIVDEAAFAQAVQAAVPIALSQHLVTFGMHPTEPHTGFGYIRRGAPLPEGDAAYVVDAFVEKPDRANAMQFIDDGGYYWNSGMFLFTAAAYLDALRRHAPEIARQAELSLAGARFDSDFVRLDEAAFAASPSVSIDYAVMEKTARAAVIASGDLGWSDVGSWSALAGLADADAAGNALIGDVLAEAVSNSYVRAEHRMVAAIGVDNIVIVETADAVLVAHRDKVQDVRKIVERLSASGRRESVMHRRVARPWGAYESIDEGDRFQVKRIVVNPGAQLSLQMHHHRAEHWIVVRGTALVTNGDQQIMLSENQSTYIPIGVTHRLTNPGRIPLELIEVQSGAYLGEDDIVRFQDTYGRAEAAAG
ncbi:mannose-1-phosphate guanylyltransferase/mannose-6-phosphate isomerase [Paraburkholderia rhynchosiae]|uniref:mannose-1-phosphate guanylyltransferase n=1 Tax=Paraburkholderia rhynchosiae TaxID=487049 RepID=A0A2N7VXR2_9BURK|nr:mannose-1-phosphate guanylyltransferase/mannose-6-phosphate isomerase [Paraburkholderia rhynchosiae]PMS21933.1 mannose-1-phosphate guanylyltransferase/mannose-6-phosphate isomerase [Paraburkholderia rhynchosiae]CAB3739012.1 Alginate biosynthesis protein AlgA [Paraburkholderia rhynchosiae]